MAIKKRYHSTILPSSQPCRSSIKRTRRVLQEVQMTWLARRVEIRTILSVVPSSLWSIAASAFSSWMSASTHLECYSGASRCVLIGGIPNCTNELIFFCSFAVRIPENRVLSLRDARVQQKNRKVPIKQDIVQESTSFVNNAVGVR